MGLTSLICHKCTQGYVANKRSDGITLLLPCEIDVQGDFFPLSCKSSLLLPNDLPNVLIRWWIGQMMRLRSSGVVEELGE
jgi:hypothetical protein